MRKHLFPLLLAAAAVTTLSACNSEATPAAAVVHEQKNNIDSLGAVLTGYETAIGDIDRLASFQDSIFQKVVITAYTIRAVDLFGALGMPGSYVDSSICKYKYARVYLGMDSLNTFKLYMVPVVDANLDSAYGGRDIHLDSLGRAIHQTDITAGEADEYVFDLNAPCPNTCAVNGPQILHAKAKK